MGSITLYHGSGQVVERPELKKGKPNNDYGQGFYCTMHRELACEWASKSGTRDGFVNEYQLDTAELATLDLTEYTILHWMTMLVRHRTFTLTSEISAAAMDYLVRNFTIDTSDYDLISGYRADDSYFSFARDFLNNTISVQHLSKAMKLGKLGIQYVLVSEKAFADLRFIRADLIDTRKYHALYMKRDAAAREQYRVSRASGDSYRDEVFIMDLIRGDVSYGDIRL